MWVPLLTPASITIANSTQYVQAGDVCTEHLHHHTACATSDGQHAVMM